MSSEADDMLGGILADAPGLGKTLTMISSIVTSLRHAENFAANREANKRRNTALISTKSTLVIVPSVREWLASCLA